MSDPYDRDRMPEPPRRIKLDILRPARQIAWWWLLPFADWGPGRDEQEINGFWIWSVIHFVLTITAAALVTFPWFSIVSHVAWIIMTSTSFLGVVLAHATRLWLRSAMHLDDAEARTYWKERFRL